MNTTTSKHAIRLINKCLWKGGAEDLYKSSFRETVRNRAAARSNVGRKQNEYSTASQQHSLRRKPSSNPMLNGVSMLQWFFDEVRPDQREVRYWMKYFSQANNPRKPFAVIQICEEVFRLEEEEQLAKEKGEVKRTILETLSLSLYFLQQNKMNVILLVGSGTPGKTAAKHKTAREQICRNIKTLVDKLEESGTRSTPIFDGGHLFNTNQDFRIESLNTRNLDWLTSHANVPVIGCVGESREGRLGVVELDEGAYSLSAYSKPLKVLLLNASGGITDHTGQRERNLLAIGDSNIWQIAEHRPLIDDRLFGAERMTIVFLPKESELQKFVDEPWWNNELESRFSKVCGILKVLPKQSSYVITSARDLLTELLTQRGVGTMFKKVVPVKRYSDLEEYVNVDGSSSKRRVKEILQELVESAFEKSANKSYWRDLPVDLESIYLTDDLKSCAIVRRMPLLPSVVYLDKFAVCKEERGNFNIEVLWQQLRHNYKSVFWRSRHDNIFNSWYEAKSDGVVKVGYYHVFWFGLSSSDINSVVKQCENLPNSFDD